MRAAVGNGEDLSVKISGNKKCKTINFDGNKVAGGNIVGLEYGNPLLLHFKRVQNSDTFGWL